MAGPSAVLFNHDTNTYEDVPASEVSSAIASGKYTSSGASTSTQAEGGTVTRSVEQLGAAETQGESDAGAVNATRASGNRRDIQRDLDSDKALSFSEGVADALSLGLIHGTSEVSELRREADSGSALLGQLVGTALGLKLPGPIHGITSGGEAVGRGLAQALLGEAETGFRGVVTRGLAEAGANSALMAASAFGHQITDSVIADKPFAAESIASEAGVGALLGFGLGFAGSAFGQLAKASRGAVEASGVAVKESRAALDSVGDLTRNWNDVVEQHAQRVGVLKVLADEGHIPGDLHLERAQSLRAAELARDALAELDPVRSLGGDPKEFQKWRSAVEKYQDAVVGLDEKMTPSMLERAHGAYGSPRQMGAAADLAPNPLAHLDVDAEMAAKGQVTSMSQELDKGMAGGAGEDWTHLKGTGEDFRARYQEIYGRPFEPGPQVHGGIEGEENLGGKQSATSEAGTNPGTRRRGAPPPSEPGVMADQRPVNDTVVDPRVERFNKQPAKYRAPHDTVIDAEGGYWDPDTQRFRKSPAKVKTPHDTVVDVEEGQTVGPRQVMEAGERPAAQAETAQDFVDTAKGELKRLPPGEGEVATENPHSPTQGKRAVKDYLNNWFREFDAKPRVSLGDQMQVRLTEALNNIAQVAGGRLDSAGSLQLLKSLGLKESTSPLGQRLDQIWSLGQAGKFAADESRGIKTPLRKGLMGQLQRYATNRGARAVGSAMLGGAVGGPVGAIVGMALTSAGFAGAAASSAGKLMTQIATVGEALLKGKRALMVSRGVLGNRPYQYSDAGVIKDPVSRIMEVQRLAANPDAIKARVTKQLGDLLLTSPEVAQHLIDTTVRNVQAISASAPMIMLSPLGKPIQPSGTALNKFFDFENAMHDLKGTLSAIQSGGASDAQIRAFHIGYPAVHGELVRGVVQNKEAMDRLDEAKLKAVERALGVTLTRATADPLITARYQANWELPKQQPQAPQAFKITAPTPTPVQASGGGRAPGNERQSK